ncbi:reverse transcriptase N-terminal domain-containing protein [Priestia aryabhattai]|uniref:reverse transcriptase N-terminal domain-containing protein n=1 Tax=Priestia aryabhattai TaxID=412384 RepID=UPI000BFC4AC6|nr:reverse transcriptase N-terminal domain-containing protein [Priestia aryabhattai]PHF65990.1 hypothetical protein COI42_23175 [Priestia aryabhattai]
MDTSLRASAHVSHKDWYSIDWSIIQKYVAKLRQRIYRAEQQNQQRRVRKLQRLLLRSKANLLLSIRRVTQQNNGKRTPGVDGYTASKPNERIKLYQQLVQCNVFRHRPKPEKRTFIPKKNEKLRPLGIPTIRDRVYQNVVKNALEPQWEFKFEPTSYGFRPKRSTHDAISNLFNKLNTNSKKKWVFEGDFSGCFDHLNHNWIMEQKSMFPGSTLIKRWLNMGYIEQDMLHMTIEGTPQGGIVSPLLANIALCGMEEEIGIVYKKTYKPNGGYAIDPKKSRKWISKRYFKKPHHGGNNKWILACPLTNIQLLKMSWIKIERHVMVAYKNSPDDPSLREYWEKRDRKVFNSENTVDRMKLARKQGYRCALCKQTLQNGETVTVRKLKVSRGEFAKLVHVPCIK